MTCDRCGYDPPDPALECGVTIGVLDNGDTPADYYSTFDQYTLCGGCADQLCDWVRP